MKNRLPALSVDAFTHLYDFPPPPIYSYPPDGQPPINCSTYAPDPSPSYRDTWWADSLSLGNGEGIAHGYTRTVAQISHTFMPYIGCINTEDDHNWPSMGLFTASGLDNAIKATAGLIRRFIEDVDTTPPSVTIIQPTATTYPHSGALTLDFSRPTDLESGVKSVTATLDGKTVSNLQTINFLADGVGLGDHTFTVAAVDWAGNVASPSVTFSIVVTAQSIMDDVNYYLSTGDISVNNEANSLLKKLQAGAAYRAAGDCKDANEVYQSFISELISQTGKKVSPTAAAIMIGDAQYRSPIAHRDEQGRLRGLERLGQYIRDIESAMGDGVKAVTRMNAPSSEAAPHRSV